MRIELTIKSEAEARLYAKALKKFDCKKINITDKLQSFDPITCSEIIRNEIPDADITLHYSLLYHYSTSLDTTKRNLQEQLTRSKNNHIKKTLIVSGNPRSKYDVLQALKDISTVTNEIYCAYNCFLTDKDLDEENARLREKNGYQNVKGIYLQIGTDIRLLERGISFCKKEYDAKEIIGSLIIPNNKTLSLLKYMTWQGVFMEDNYLNDIKFAQEITSKIINTYVSHKIEPLVTILPFNEEDLETTIIYLKNSFE